MARPHTTPSPERRVLALQRSIQALAPIVALIVLILGLSIGGGVYFFVRWPLLVAAVILGATLAAAPLAHRAGGALAQRAAQSLSTIAAMLVLLYPLSRFEELSPRWSFALAAVILAIGLTAGPLAQLIARRMTLGAARSLAAATALVVLIVVLAADDPHSFPTRWPLALAVVILICRLAAEPFAERIGGGSRHLAVQTVGAGVALVIVLDGLTNVAGIPPRWSLALVAVMLGLELAAGRFARLRESPGERVLSARVDELSRTRRGALDVQATELRRIERDLHDGAQARLVALSMKLGRAEDRFGEDPEIGALLREAREDAAAAIRELRELARGIAPPVLSDRGLEAAVRSLAQRTGAKVAVSGTLQLRPQPAVETAAYFVVAESLTNAAKHAAGARVEVRLDERGGDLFVEVTDFGPGRANPDGGGLTGLRQRVEALDGALHVTSPAGVGTQVEAVLPCGR